jgi:hypothetical protein
MTARGRRPSLEGDGEDTRVLLLEHSPDEGSSSSARVSRALEPRLERALEQRAPTKPRRVLREHDIQRTRSRSASPIARPKASVESLSPPRLKNVASAVRSALKLTSADVARDTKGEKMRSKPKDEEESRYHSLEAKHSKNFYDSRPSSAISRPVSAAGNLMSGGALVHMLKRLNEAGADPAVRAGYFQSSRRSPDLTSPATCVRTEESQPDQGDSRGDKDAERQRIAWMVDLKVPTMQNDSGKRRERCMNGCHEADAVVTHVCRQCRDFLVVLCVSCVWVCRHVFSV